jgi:hypothetical protein
MLRAHLRTFWKVSEDFSGERFLVVVAMIAEFLSADHKCYDFLSCESLEPLQRSNAALRIPCDLKANGGKAIRT